MTSFIPVGYHKRRYPPEIKCEIEEVAGNFGKTTITDCERYSLHTEYSFTKRVLEESFSKRYPILASSTYNGIPLLWTSTEWADRFADFVINITAGKKSPEVIEVHPPFRDTCTSVQQFLDRFASFERKIRTVYPKVTICIENRAGSQYRKASFLISTIEDVSELITACRDIGSSLKVALDYPQLFTAYHKEPFEMDMGIFLERHHLLDDCRESISSVHMWGKKRNDAGRLVAHSGDLNSLFDGDLLKKSQLLSLISSFYNDGVCRYFVPEVNSCDEDLHSILRDCMNVGIRFDGIYYSSK